MSQGLYIKFFFKHKNLKFWLLEMCVSVQTAALALQKILINEKWKPRLGGKLSKWEGFLNKLQQWYIWFLPHSLSTHKFRDRTQCTVHGEAALSVGYCDLPTYPPHHTFLNGSSWKSTQEVCKEPKLVLLQSVAVCGRVKWFHFNKLTSNFLAGCSLDSQPVTFLL